MPIDVKQKIITSNIDDLIDLTFNLVLYTGNNNKVKIEIPDILSNIVANSYRKKGFSILSNIYEGENNE